MMAVAMVMAIAGKAENDALFMVGDSCTEATEMISLAAKAKVDESREMVGESREMADESREMACERPQWKQVVVPAAVFGVGATGLIKGSPLHSWGRDIHNEVVKHDYHTSIDNSLQYAPVAMHLGLGLAGVKARHSLAERAVVAATSYITMTALVNGMKYTVREKRPDCGTRNSFPSGHTATVFTGAELVRIEYGTGWGIAAYGIATATAAMRLYNDRHWLQDVVAGAGIGMLSARAGYWLLPMWRNVLGIKKKDTAVSVIPWALPSGNQYGMTAAIAF